MNLQSISDFTAASVRARIQKEGPAAETGREAGKQEFRELLQQAGDTQTEKSQGLSFSKHASKRLSQRGITLSDGQKSDLESAVERAREKGAKEIAVIGSQGVFIVNVPNNVVVTTMTQEDMKQKILTNIDSAVIM